MPQWGDTRSKDYSSDSGTQYLYVNLYDTWEILLKGRVDTGTPTGPGRTQRGPDVSTGGLGTGRGLTSPPAAGGHGGRPKLPRQKKEYGRKTVTDGVGSSSRWRPYPPTHSVVLDHGRRVSSTHSVGHCTSPSFWTHTRTRGGCRVVGFPGYVPRCPSTDVVLDPLTSRVGFWGPRETCTP